MMAGSIPLPARTSETRSRPRKKDRPGRAAASHFHGVLRLLDWGARRIPGRVGRMTHSVLRASACFLLLMSVAAGIASAQTCIRIDESQDTLAQDERTAALLLMQKQFV